MTAAADQRVVPRAALDLVRPAVADQRVAEGRAFEVLEFVELVVAVAAGFVLAQRGPDAGALAARHRGREGGDVVLPRPARHAVVAVVAVDEVVVAGPAVDGVDAEAAGDVVVVPRPAAHLVVAEVAEDAVGAGPAEHFVVAAAAVDHVVAGAAADEVVAEAGVDRVVPRAAPDHVAPRRPVQDVVAGGADDRRDAPVAAVHFFARGAGPGGDRVGGDQREDGHGEQHRSPYLVPASTHDRAQHTAGGEAGTIRPAAARPRAARTPCRRPRRRPGA